ncbi:MAG TPA: methyltransferase domain-containing protein [Ignavibacteria bacterium]
MNLGQQKEIRFDNYVDTYKKEIQHSINFIGQDVDFFIEIKAKMLLQLAEKFIGRLGSIKALDIGSGVGLVDKHIAPHLGSLTGVDIEEGVVQKAKMYNPDVNYLVYNGQQLPFSDNSFDLVFAVNVIHHVPAEGWQNFTDEMKRVIRPDGIAFIFEHNPANPLTRKAVDDCEFDRDAVLLPHKKIKQLFENSGLKIIDDSYIIFFPFKCSFFRSVEMFIKWLPLGAQQYVAGRKS